MENQSSIQLDAPCITASSLRYVLSPFKWEDHSGDSIQDLYDRIYKMSISIIRRVKGVAEAIHYITEAGKIMEDEVVELFFSDTNRYETQKKADKEIMVNGVPVPFRATIDVYDNQINKIIEIKYAVNAKPKDCFGDSLSKQDLKTLTKQDWDDWVQNSYVVGYSTQAQVQMLCCECDALDFLVCSRHADATLGQSFFKVPNFKKDVDFINKNQTVILKFWNELQRVWESFLSEDKQVVLDVYKNTEYQDQVSVLISDDIKRLVELYSSYCLKKRLLESRMENLKSSIVTLMKVDELNDISHNRVHVKKGKPKVSIKYADIVKDMGLLDKLTDEEMKKYSRKIEESYTFRYLSDKKEDIWG